MMMSSATLHFFMMSFYSFLCSIGCLCSFRIQCLLIVCYLLSVYTFVAYDWCKSLSHLFALHWYTLPIESVTVTRACLCHSISVNWYYYRKMTASLYYCPLCTCAVYMPSVRYTYFVDWNLMRARFFFLLGVLS